MPPAASTPSTTDDASEPVSGESPAAMPSVGMPTDATSTKTPQQPVSPSEASSDEPTVAPDPSTTPTMSQGEEDASSPASDTAEEESTDTGSGGTSGGVA